jgi:cell division septation protein DedD
MRGKGWTNKAAVTVASLVVCAVAIVLGYLMGNYAMTAISTKRQVPTSPPAEGPAKPATQASPSAPERPQAENPSPAEPQLLTDLDDAQPTAATSGPAAAPPAASVPLFRVQIGPFSTRQEAVGLSGQLLADGYHAYITSDRPYRVQVGAFSRREAADRLAAELKGRDYADVKVVAPTP